MHSLTAPTLALAAFAAIQAVSAHGYVSGIVSGGKWYKATDPGEIFLTKERDMVTHTHRFIGWYYQSTKPTQAGWYALNQDNGFVAPDAYGTGVGTIVSEVTACWTNIKTTGYRLS